MAYIVDYWKAYKPSPPPPTDGEKTLSDTNANTMLDSLPKNGMSRIRTVVQVTGLSKSTIYNWIKDGKFPKPIKLSKTMSLWRNSDILQWINELSDCEPSDHASDHATPTNTKQ